MKSHNQSSIFSIFGFVVLFQSLIVSSSIVTTDLDGFQIQSNDADNLPNNLQPFLPEDSDGSLYIRALLCPDTPLDALPYYRFHLISRLCYEVGTQGPCGSNMIFVKEPLTKAIGKCICVSSVESNNHRPLVRDPGTNQCYYVYSQAFCQNDEWLVLNENGHVACEENPCIQLQQEITLQDEMFVNNTTDNITDVDINTTISDIINSSLNYTDELRDQNQQVEYVMYNGTCSQLDSSSEYCEQDQILSFFHGQLTCVTNSTLVAVVNSLNSISSGNDDEEANKIHYRR